MIPRGISAQSDAVGAAVSWIVALLTGSLATLIAVLAVAGVGLALLQGGLR